MVFIFLKVKTDVFMKSGIVDSNISKALELIKKTDTIIIPINHAYFFGLQVNLSPKLYDALIEIINNYNELSEEDKYKISSNVIKIARKYIKLYINTTYYRIKEVEEFIERYHRENKETKTEILCLEFEPLTNKAWIQRRFIEYKNMWISEAMLGRWAPKPVNSSDIQKAKIKMFVEIFRYLGFHFLI